MQLYSSAAAKRHSCKATPWYVRNESSEIWFREEAANRTLRPLMEDTLSISHSSSYNSMLTVALQRLGDFCCKSHSDRSVQPSARGGWLGINLFPVIFWFLSNSEAIPLVLRFKDYLISQSILIGSWLRVASSKSSITFDNISFISPLSPDP